MEASAAIGLVCLADAFAVGATAALQAGMNRTIGEHLGHAMFGTFMSFIGANILLLAMNIAATTYRVYFESVDRPNTPANSKNVHTE